MRLAERPRTAAAGWGLVRTTRTRTRTASCRISLVGVRRRERSVRSSKRPWPCQRRARYLLLQVPTPYSMVPSSSSSPLDALKPHALVDFHSSRHTPFKHWANAARSLDDQASQAEHDHDWDHAWIWSRKAAKWVLFYLRTDCQRRGRGEEGSGRRRGVVSPPIHLSAFVPQSS